MINNKTIRQVVINSKMFPCSGTSYHEVTGSICNFITDLAAPLKSCEVTVTPSQSGTGDPSPTNPRPLNSFSSLKVEHTGKNLLNLKGFSSWDFIGNVYAVQRNACPRKPLKAVFLDKDTTVDLTGCYLGFIDSTYESGSLQTNNYRWIINNGVVAQILDNYPVNNDTNKRLDGLIIYPRTEETYNKIFARYDVMCVVPTDTATAYEPYHTDPHTFDLGSTVYGGSVDIISGTGVIDYGYLVLDGSEEWDLYTPQYGFALSISGMKKGSAMTGYSNFLPTITSSANFGIRFGGALVNDIIYCCRIIGNIEGVTDLESWKTYLSTNNLTICYPLEVPETLVVEPQTINTLEGVNNIWNDAGETTVKYPLSGGSCNGIMKFLPIFYPNGKGVNHNGSTF